MANPKKERQFYLGNENLPVADATFDYEKNPEWVKDLEKCKRGILYFAENFFYIINLDRGREKIRLRVFQKRILKALKDERFVVMLSSRQAGKALALDTPVPTPSGWKTMGDLKDNDEIYDMNGAPCKVLKAHDIMHDRSCYEIEFSNGDKVIADEEHLWLTQSHYDRCYNKPAKKRTTKELLKKQSINIKNPQVNYSIPHHSGTQNEIKSLPIDPYFLGAWLGDGTRCSTGITIGKEDLTEMLKCLNIPREAMRLDSLPCGHFTVHYTKQPYKGKKQLITILKENNLFKNKHIPEIYKYSSIEQRLELIRGLMDTDGHIEDKINVFSNTNFKLIEGFREILYSLGIQNTVTKWDLNSHNGKIGKPIYRVNFTAHYSVFKLPRKKEKQNISNSTHVKNVFIKRIIPVKSVPVRCITADNSTGTFLFGKSHIVTSNTTLMTIYALWIVCFQSDQNILVVANKESTAIAIFKRIRMAYEQLPNYLKPGVTVWGKTSMELANGSSIGISTTSSDAGRGSSCNLLLLDELAFIDCVSGKTTVTVRDKETGLIKDITISDLEKELSI